MVGNGSHIDSLFRDGLRKIEVTPPPEVWEEIRGNLQVKKKRIPVFAYAVAASVSLLILAGTAWMLIFNQPRTEDVAQTLVPGGEVSQPVIPQGQESLSEKQNAGPLTAAPAVREEQAIAVTPVSPDNETGTSLVRTGAVAVAETAEKEAPPMESGMGQDENLPQSTSTLSTLRYRSALTLQSVETPVRLAYLSDQTGYPVQMDPQTETMADELREKTPRWSVGGQASPTYSFRYIGKKSLDSYRDMYNDLEEGIVTYSGGLYLNFRSNTRLSIHTGLYYAKMGQQINDIQLFTTADGSMISLPTKGDLAIRNSTGEITTTNEYLFLQDNVAYRVKPLSLVESYDPVKIGLVSMKADIFQNFEYLEIPLILRYKVINRKMDVHLLGGLSTNFLVRNDAYAMYHGEKISIGETSAVQTVNYSSTLGFGIEYSLSDKITFNLEPSFKYYINSINRDTGILTHPYSIGIFTGLSYYFR